jgi:hypothetical protein
MVRFRFGRETSSTRVLRAPRESVRVMDRSSLAETAARLASRAIGIWTLRFAFGRGAGPPEFRTTGFAVNVGVPDEPLSSHSPTCRSVDWRRPRVFPPSLPSGQTRLPNSEAPLMFVPCPFVRAQTAVSGREILDSTFRRTITRLGADHRAARLGRGSQRFDALDAMRLQHWSADLTSWPRMSRRLRDETLVQL